MASGTKINIDLVLNTKGFRPLGRINGQLGEFEKSLDASNARVLAFGASAGAILAVKKAFTATVRSMIEVEKSLTDINVVLNTSSANLKKFGSDLFAIASQTGQSFKVAAEAATEFSRQGLGLTETLKRTRDALILARLSGMEATEAVNSLTAALNTFNDVGLDSTTIINKLANVDAAFAVSSDDLAKALGRVGASAKGAGVNFDQLLAIVTTAQQKTARGGAVIGNSFKTIFTRIQRPKVLGQLEELGIQVKGLSGETLPAIKILTNLARSFDFLTQAQRAQVAELVGGVFQVNILKAALSDLSSEQSIYSKALKVSAGSTDEAIQRNTRLNETLSAQFNRVVNSFKEGAAELGTLTLEPAISNLLNVGDAIADASKSESGVAKAGQFIGKTLFSAIGKFMGGPGLLIIGFTLFKTFKQLGTFAADAFRTLTGLNKNFQNQLNLQKQIFEVLSENPDLMSKIKRGAISIEDAHEQIYDQIQKNTGALDAQLLVSQQLAQSLVGSGVGISPDFGATTGGKKEFGAKKKKGRKSFGYIPNFVEDRDEVLGMVRGGYSTSQIKNPKTRKQTLHNGRGGSFRATVNDHEDIFEARSSKGKRGTFVVPPKGSDAYKKYMAGLQGGQRGKTMAEGFIPNFIKVPWLKTGKASNRIGEVMKGDLGDVSNRQVQSLVDKGYIADPRTKTAAAKKTSKKSTKTKREKNLEGDLKKDLARGIDVKGAYGVLSLFGGGSMTEGRGPIKAGKSKIKALGPNQAAIPPSIILKNFQKRAFIGGTKEEKKSNKFAHMVRDRFREPFADLTGDFIKGFGINKKHVKSLDKKEAGKITESLFPPGAEGSIFEAAISAITQDSKTFRKGLKDDPNLTWDFDGNRKANSSLKDAFNMEGLLFADGKRTVNAKVERNLVNKVFNHVKKGGGGPGSNVIKGLIRSSQEKKKSSGYIPNFNTLFESIRREKDAGVDRNTIRLDRNTNLVSNSNPLGLGIYNTEDEPRGLKQGVSRERRRGRNPKRAGGKSRGYIPNFAPKPKPPAKGGKDSGGDVKAASGMFADSAGKLMGGIFAMNMGFSALRTAVEGNETATWALKEVEQTLTNSVYLLVGAVHLLKKSNKKLVDVNKKRLKAGKKPIEESKMTDLFTKEGRAKRQRNRDTLKGDVETRFKKTGFRFEKKGVGRTLENFSKGRDRKGRFMKKRGRIGGLMRSGAGMVARGAAGAGMAGGALGGGMAAVGAAAAPVAAALAVAYIGIKATDAFFQFFKVRDAEKAKKSFDSITERNQQLSNDLQKYSEALQKFSQSMEGASVESVMTATSQLNAQLMKLGPEIREKFVTQFDPVSANALIQEEQERLSNENKRAENRAKLTKKTAELGDKEGIWENFKRGISGGALGAQIDEKAEERDFRRMSQNILGADENVKGGLGAALKRKSGEEGGAEKVQDIINTLSSGNPEAVAGALKSLGYSQETIDTFQQSMERSGSAGLRLREGMASLVIETDKANQLQKALGPTIKRITEEIAKQRAAIDKQVKAMEVERKIRLKVGAEMAKGANLFLSSIGQVDLKREMDLTSARGNRAVALTKAANITQTAFGSQGAQNVLKGMQGGAQIGAGINTGIKMLGSTNPREQAQGTAMLKAAQAQLNAQVESTSLGIAEQKTAETMQNQLNSLITTEKNSGEELKNQTKEISAVADAQKKTLEIQKKIATAGGVRFEGFGEQLKKLSTNRLLGGIAARSGSRVGAARFKGREMDIVQELQGGTLTAGQRAGAMGAAQIEGQAKLGLGARMGLQGGAFDTLAGRTDAARLKSQARFKTDAVTGAGAPPEVTQALLHSQKTFEDLTKTMREVTEQNIALEKKKVEQMEVIAKLTKQFNDHLKEQADLRKKAADFEARNGLALVNGIKGFSEGVSKFKTAQEQGMRGALSIDLTGIADQKIRQEVALAIKDMNRAQAAANLSAGGEGGKLFFDSARQASVVTGTQSGR